MKWICDFLLEVREPQRRLCEPVFICYFLPELMCGLHCVRVMPLVVFELRQNRLLDQITTAVLENDWKLFMTVSWTRLVHFFIYGTSGFCPRGSRSRAFNFRMTTGRMRSRTTVVLGRLVNDSS
jgi:hypothetical protein